MDFPPLDDVRWDRLLGAVLQVQPLDPRTEPLRAPHGTVAPLTSPQPHGTAAVASGLDTYA